MTTKTILITGGTSGIGFACAAYLLQHNYQVLITGQNPENLKKALEQLGDKATGYLSDTSSMQDIVQLAKKVKATFNRIDGLFINAGIFQAASFEATTEDLFDKTMGINFKGAFFTMQHFIPLLNNPSSIVLNTSVVVFKSFSNTSVYTASKAALESVAKVLNVELKDKGIRINTVSPGVTRTPIQQKSGMTTTAIEQLMDHFSAVAPLGRIVEPEDIAPIVAFLMSDHSFALRNAKIVVDGGSTLL
ncbi:MAG: SDR family oxidoreductase [Aureispira sp.]